MLRQLYFNTKFVLRSYIKVVLGCVFALNCVMIFMFMELEKALSIWWAPIFLQDIVLHFYIFIQMVYDYRNRQSQQFKWQKNLMI